MFLVFAQRVNHRHRFRGACHHLKVKFGLQGVLLVIFSQGGGVFETKLVQGGLGAQNNFQGGPAQ